MKVYGSRKMQCITVTRLACRECRQAVAHNTTLSDAIVRGTEHAVYRHKDMRKTVACTFVGMRDGQRVKHTTAL